MHQAEAIPAALRRWLESLAQLLLTQRAAFGFCVAMVFWLLRSHTAFGLQDEAHLWYGAQRVLDGEIPLRDFHGYDPGRYYFTALVMALLHSHGIIAVRVAEALTSGFGIGLALSLIFRRDTRSGILACLSVLVVLLIWSHQRHKLFDSSCGVVLTAGLAWMLDKPSRWRCFTGGAVVGVIAIVGRNHGLYGAVASVAALAVMVWVERRMAFWPTFFYWGLGLLAGYSPMILASIFVPDFWQRLLISVQVYFDMGETSNYVPVRWPWRVAFSQPLDDVVRDLIVGSLFIVMPLYGLVVSGYYIWRAAAKKLPVDPIPFAGALLAIPYTHHAVARAGAGHIGQAIYPMLISAAVLALGLAPRPRLATLASACAISLFVMIPYQFEHGVKGAWQDAQVGTDTLYVSAPIARRVQVLTALVDKYAPHGEEFVAAPYLPAAYALVDRRAAVWDPYVFFNFGPKVQQIELARIQAEKPAFVLIEDDALDGDPGLAYRRTNPQVYEYITSHFTQVQDPLIPGFWGWHLYLPPAATSTSR